MHIDPQTTVVVTGAGISVDSGIRPFRGKDGIWEENPMEMATFRKFMSDPAHFLSWYYQRFVSCRNAVPNEVHEVLSDKGFRVITQNVDDLHQKANHPADRLIEIHGNIRFKRPVQAMYRDELRHADWESIDEDKLVPSLFDLFRIHRDGEVDIESSLRPHILLFDEYYTELYEYEKAITWVEAAETIIFAGTSNSVGITEGILSMSVRAAKRIIVVDPNPSNSFRRNGVELVEKNAKAYFCDLIS